MKKQSKRIRFQYGLVPSALAVEPALAIDLLLSMEAGLPSGVRGCKFDQTVTVCARLGVDPRQADQIVRGSIVLPHGIGKSQRVLVFAQGEVAAAALEAGADVVGAKDLADRIKAGFLEFDVAIASVDMMPVVGPLGKVLGPRGLMPSTKAGTVTNDVVSAIAEYKAGKVEFRCDSGGNVNCIIGKMSFSRDKLLDNFTSLLRYLRSIKPSASKGIYFRRVGVGATMTPNIAVVV
jgi:large subunit ribosomal protein L1